MHKEYVTKGKSPDFLKDMTLNPRKKLFRDFSLQYRKVGPSINGDADYLKKWTPFKADSYFEFSLYLL